MSNKNIVSIQDLLKIPTGCFLQSSFLCVLGRSADSQGLAFYSKKMREGYSRKIILAELRSSDEGKMYAKNYKSKELDRLVWMYQLLNVLPFQSFKSKFLLKHDLYGRDIGFEWDVWLRNQLNLFKTSAAVEVLHVDDFKERADEVFIPSPIEGISMGEYKILRDFFDADYYRVTYPDIDANSLDPFVHFCISGWREKRNPAPWFSVARYIADYPQVTGNPFLHYLQTGQIIGYKFTPVGSELKAGLSTIEGMSDDEFRILKSFFDVDYYCLNYPDIVEHNLDPFEHFCISGWEEGRNPAPWFSTKHYLASYKDVKGNPFLHYITVGKSENRFVRAANVEGPCELIVDQTSSLVKDNALHDLIRFEVNSTVIKKMSFNPKRLKIHWVIPDFSAGGGGHMTIFRMVRWLEVFGHECVVWIVNPNQHKTVADAYDTIVKNFQTIRADVRFADDEFLDQAKGDCIIATSWETVAYAVAATEFAGKFYFVQDFEPAFHAMGSYSLVAEMTYKRKDFAYICASPWLSQILSQRYGGWARYFWLGYEHATYSEEGVEVRGAEIPHIAVYSRIATARRAVELAFLALELLASRGVKFHADLFGQDLPFVSAKFPSTSHGVLSAEKLASLYRRADIGVCFSATNYSLVPQEMMACGLPIVELDVESTRAIFPDDVITRAEPSPSAIADALEALIMSPEKRFDQAEKALKWVSQFDWQTSGRAVEGALIERLSELGHSIKEPVPANNNQIKVSVCIPTYNGGDLLISVINKVMEQKVPWPFEVVIVDSSSQDGSFEIASKIDGVVSIQIKQSEFGHGKTRNLACSLSRGEFIAFLTQDALPADDNWLYNLVALLEHFPNSAGAFGRHVAYPDASPFIKRDLINHFDGFSAFPISLSKDTDPEKWASGDIGWRQVLHFYSDNNSCMRRSVWEKIPYADVEFGEDQIWANEIIKHGFEKIYAPGSVVFHSHDFTPHESEKRSFEEAFFFHKYFGYKVYEESIGFDLQLKRMNDADEAFAKQSKISGDLLYACFEDNRARLCGARKATLKEKI